MFIRAGIMLIIWVVFGVFASDYLIVEAPIGTTASDKVIWVKWAGSSRGAGFKAPDSGFIYFDRAPGGGKLSNYKYKVTVPWTDSIKEDNIFFGASLSDPVAKRGTSFKPVDQANMGSGVFYCIVALPRGDTLISNEFQIIVESPNAVDWIGPKGQITNLTPTFQWNANSGVPYYHVILSDDAIKIDSTDSGKVDLQGMSIIWQAITPNTQIVYGSPDPSHTITADPPPLSPGQHYTWMVLNNYGNHPAYSSTKVKLPPGEFTIGGTTLKKPVCIYPNNQTLNNRDNKKIDFKWSNLDKNANTYKVYVYVKQAFEGISAKMAVFQTEVTASKTAETLSVSVDAASVFTSNDYSWRVIAVDAQGAGTTSDTVGFSYSAPNGTINIHTRELISIGNGTSFDTVINPVGLVEMRVEVLDGSLESPLLFYTDNDGNLSRTRPTGTYKITAVKNQYENSVQTVTLADGETKNLTFYLERPEATIFGKVVDKSNKTINLAVVTGVSDRGDTVTTKSDALGNFVLNCYGADWNIGAQLTGYKSVVPKKVTVSDGESFNFGTIYMEQNPYTLSGVVKNTLDQTLLGVKICLFKDGVLISSLPSTPQTGAFSFSVSAGTYLLTAQKTGFTSYSSSVDVMSTKNITLKLQAGATLVSGYVYGKAWVGEREIIAPIVNATVKFKADSGNDSFTSVSDATYGDFKISLPGGKKYLVYSSASGYAVKETPLVFSTQLNATQFLYDTLQSLGMISGNVKMRSDGSKVGSVAINLINETDEKVVANGKTSADGYFEISGIPDGTYHFGAGKSGLVYDGTDGTDSVRFESGRPSVESVNIYMKSGTKTVKWNISGVSDFKGSIKVQSPVIKTLESSDSLTGAGSGLYIMQVDAKADSVIDLSYHRFSVSEEESTHVDSIRMNVFRSKVDTLVPIDGKISLSLMSPDTLDSASVFYKTVDASTYGSTIIRHGLTNYVFTFVPPRDGSQMVFYYKAFRKKDVFGYDKEVYNAFVAADTGRLTKFEISPSSNDTMEFPSKYEIPLTFKGYYSSAFIPDQNIDGQSIKWSISNAQGCSLEKTTGLNTIVKSGSTHSTSPIIVTATIDTTRTKIATGIGNTVSIPFIISGSQLAGIRVRRIDSRNPNPISTSPTDQAEFKADGIDVNGKQLSVSPSWEISPASAGFITLDGVFHPRSNFVGIVRVFAKTNDLTGEYSIENSNEAGLNVRHLVVAKNTTDTAVNGKGCMLTFPSGCVNGSEMGIIEMRDVGLKNKVKLGLGDYKTIDTTALNITELNGLSLSSAGDSMRLSFTIPEILRKQAITGSAKLWIACWNEDSLQWDPLLSSIVSSDGKQISAGLTHFSTYTVIFQAPNTQFLKVSPNPFSPYIKPRNPSDPSKQVPADGRTCINFEFSSGSDNIDVKVKIFNVVGDLVYSLRIMDARSGKPYFVWWDGRTSDKELWDTDNQNIYEKCIKGNLMCRNGRYFVVVSAKDRDNKERRLMKQIVLMK